MTPTLGPTLTTERLILRRWREEDRAPFARMNADPIVMRHFVRSLSRAGSDALLDQLDAGFEKHAFGTWAVERREDGRFLGFVGLSVPMFDAPFNPCVEVGWRFDQFAWGNGYATEAGRQALRYGFEEAGLAEIVSFTSALNERSIAVMERLGMHRDPADDFDDPRIAVGHPLRRHVLYRLRREEFA